MSLAIGLILAACLPFGLPLLFGADFSPAVPAAFILLAAVVLVIPGSIAGAGLSARGRPGMRSLSLLAACVLNVGALFLLVPSLGAVGAALATLIGNIVASQLNIVCINRVSGIPLRSFYGFRRSDLGIISTKGRDAVAAIRNHPLQRLGGGS
jgi:O-antigen/teichoic acid export membrane protein